MTKRAQKKDSGGPLPFYLVKKMERIFLRF